MKSRLSLCVGLMLLGIHGCSKQPTEAEALTPGAASSTDQDAQLKRPFDWIAASACEVVRVLGGDFENALAREEGRRATLDEVRAAVERDLLHARTQEANEAFYARLRSDYAVRIDDRNDAADAAADPAG